MCFGARTPRFSSFVGVQALGAEWVSLLEDGDGGGVEVDTDQNRFSVCGSIVHHGCTIHYFNGVCCCVKLKTSYVLIYGWSKRSRPDCDYFCIIIIKLKLKPAYFDRQACLCIVCAGSEWLGKSTV